MKNIFVHGLGQNSSAWDKTISYLAEQDFVCRPDLFSLLGGRDTTYENLYHTFSEYCGNISEPLNICGLSLGAVLALNYAIACPEKINSLVLIAGQYKMPKMLLKFQNIIFRFMPQKAFTDMGFEKKDFIKLTNSMLDINFTESLKYISCPVLVLCGEKDSANRRAAEKLSEKIPESEIQLVKNAGHEVNIEAPEKLAEILNKFYNNYF